MLPLTEDELNQLPPDLAAEIRELRRDPYDGRFAPKLTHEQRCSILAAVIMGHPREAVAHAFGVNRRTITHICNRSSPSYKSVRDEYDRHGKAEFLRMFLTDEVRNKVREAAKSEEAKKSTTRLRADQAAKLSAQKQASGPDAKATKRKGSWTIKCSTTETMHEFNIDWLAHPSNGVEGWYFQQPEIDDFWSANPSNGEPFLTSQDAYTYIEREHNPM